MWWNGTWSSVVHYWFRRKIIYIVFMYRFPKSNVLEGRCGSVALLLKIDWVRWTIIEDNTSSAGWRNKEFSWRSEEWRTKIWDAGWRSVEFSFELENILCCAKMEWPSNPRTLASCKPLRSFWGVPSKLQNLVWSLNCTIVVLYVWLVSMSS